MKGKLVDTWIWEYEGVPVGETQIATIKVPVKLWLHKKFKDSDKPPMATKDVSFSVTCTSPEFKLEGSDIECLRTSMWDMLSEHFKVVWEDYFLVEVRPEHGYGGGRSTGLVFEYKSVEKGTAWDGTLLMRHYEYMQRQKIDTWPGEFKAKHDGSTIACIRATPANRKALDNFGKRIDKLREILAEFMRPEKIMATLADMTGLRMLPEARDEDVA